ncbi:sugar phosphate isomerase/epimerase family protein [Actinomadura miaoliensis]|uniref:Sugar phosphate isomerase/epimerase n=1 Tax=Actinomadura miaoliensis TaxID=430685 RepID=A0ABP7WHA8_9ACTN
MDRISCQERLLPGRTLRHRWDFAVRAGYAAIELCAPGEPRDRLPELRAAAREGVVIRTVCAGTPPRTPDPGPWRDAAERVRTHLSVIAELGGAGVVTPVLTPPSPDGRAGDRGPFPDIVAELGEHAAKEGVTLFLAPLNRYEHPTVNRLEQAVALVREVGLDSVRVAAGTFHMNIEEADPAAAVLAAAPWLGHVHLSDSNRLQPGAGHLDWPVLLGALDAAGYDGDLAVEGRVPDEPEEAMASVPGFLRRASLRPGRAAP